MELVSNENFLIVFTETNPTEETEQMTSSSIGNALRLLASRRQKIAKQTQLIANAQLRQAEAELKEQQKLKLEKDILLSQIEKSKRREINKAKLKAQAQRRDTLLSQLKRKKANKAHQSLIEASNTRILSRHELLYI